MPAALQKFLPIKVELRLPTVDLAGARALTGMHENALKLWIEGRELIAWDISRGFASATKNDESRARREIRILTASARDAAAGKTIVRDEDTLILLVYGRPRQFILGKNFCRSWNCDSGHMCNLVADGILQTIQNTSYGRGRGNTPCITWASAVQFLQSRRIS